MKKEVFIVSDNIISPIGSTTGDNFAALTIGISGARQHTNPAFSDQPFYASIFTKERPAAVAENSSYTFFEKLLIASVQNALQHSSVDIAGKKTVLIISTTKGNIGLLDTGEYNDSLKERIALHTSARLVAAHFHCVNQPIVVSNACISGSLAVLMAQRLLQSGRYEHAVVTGADLLSKFILAGFQSFQAVSGSACKPFDADRTGINLGEGAATMILSSNKAFSSGVSIAGGATSNDANHISGPSRTGEELCNAIRKAMKAADVAPGDINYISAHGTATLYNDEMEALAITGAGLQNVPVNSLKGYYGHTLGAAGLIESIIGIHSMKENLVLNSKGYSEAGVSKPLNISTRLQDTNINHFLKTASGFGGCNAALIFSKIHSS